MLSERCELRGWLFDTVLPLWWERGACPEAAGGFHDRLLRDGRPDARPLRLRVQARQTFVYAEAGRLGWSGPWAAAVDQGLRSLFTGFRRPDGLYRSAVAPSGAIVDDGVDLYDQAFVLLALASVWQVERSAGLLTEAEGLLGRLRQALAHPIAGFDEARPRRLPLRSNPHMHLLEAMFAWIGLGVEGAFAETAHMIVRLAASHLIDRTTGAIGEFYDGEWQPLPGDAGRLREPGHQFEWAYLLSQAGNLLGLDTASLVVRLYAFGTAHGIRDGLVVGGVDAQGHLIDGSSRLWQQTERLRTTLTVGPAFDPLADTHAREALAGFRRFLIAGAPGFWHDRIGADGVIVEEASPASSLYHILTGLEYLVADG